MPRLKPSGLERRGRTLSLSSAERSSARRRSKSFFPATQGTPTALPLLASREASHQDGKTSGSKDWIVEDGYEVDEAGVIFLKVVMDGYEHWVHEDSAR